MNANATSEAQFDTDADGDPVYFYKPNLMGSAWVFGLKRNGIAWEFGRRSGLVRYDQVRRVRLSYRPATLQSHRFLTEIWGPESRGLMEQARQDAPYAAFVGELHRRLAAAGGAARFESGMNPLLYWVGAAVMAAIGVILAVMLVRALLSGDLTGVAVIAGAILIFAWQVGTMFYRNRPQTYRPDAPPAVVMPRA